jgi:hypothetical protein
MSKKSPQPNDLCQCGSRRKYKKCCGSLGSSKMPMLRPATPAEVERARQIISQAKQKEVIRRERFGNVKPVITAQASGRRVIAVNEGIFFAPENSTFPEILFFFLQYQLGTDWLKQQESAPPKSRHPLAEWINGFFRHLESMAKEKPKDENGALWLKPNGLMKANLQLGYDLYTLQHHGLLEDRMMARIRQREQFQGARYEAFVIAAMIRAGIQIEFEDETDNTQKHPEFIATDIASQVRFTVEAKSRHRSGVLGRPGTQDLQQPLTLLPLIEKALTKKKDIPIIIFVDMNAPSHPGALETKPWYPEFSRMLHSLPKNSNGKFDFASIIFTNVPYHYANDSSPAPAGEVITFGNGASSAPLPKDLIARIHHWVSNFGEIPSTFEESTSEIVSKL